MFDDDGLQTCLIEKQISFRTGLEVVITNVGILNLGK